jgi:hypothetical protein
MGRLSKYGKSGVSITEEVKKQIKEVLETYYFNKPESTLAFAYDMFILKYYSRKIIQEDGSEIIQAIDEIPTMRQFHYWSRKLYNPTQTIQKKLGEKRFQKDHRGTKGSSIYEDVDDSHRHPGLNVLDYQ